MGHALCCGFRHGFVITTLTPNFADASHTEGMWLLRSAAESAVLIVGPEGDFTPQELGALMAAGATPVGLGSRRLRVETAALALLAVVQACCEA